MRKILLFCLTLTLCLPTVASQAVEPEVGNQFSATEMTLRNSLTENNGFKTIVLNSGNGKIRVGNAVVITYPTTVKLKKKGCQNIPITYKTYIMDSVDYVNVGIINDEDYYLGWVDAYRTPFYSAYWSYGNYVAPEGSTVKIYKKSGKSKIKICRKDWVDGDGDPMAGASKGNFQLEVETANWRYVADIKLK
jgi:hypothetical protein